MRRRLLKLASGFLAIVAGCERGEVTDYTGWSADYTGWVAEDLDDDGWDSSEDCDDGDPAVNPGATEVCDDTVDNDCDELADAADPDCA